jgi:hypothetical protein
MVSFDTPTEWFVAESTPYGPPTKDTATRSPRYAQIKEPYFRVGDGGIQGRVVPERTRNNYTSS